MTINRLITGLGIATGTTATVWHMTPEDKKTQMLMRCGQVHADQSLVQHIPGKDASIFGFGHCQYKHVRDCIPQMHSHTPDYECFNLPEPRTESGEFIEHLTRREQEASATGDYRLDTERNRFAQYTEICKTWLNDVILENYRRKQAGLPILPVLFCTDVVDNPHPLAASPESAVPKGTRYITAHEITRAYKLINHPDPRISATAKETFQFMRVNYERKGLSVQMSVTDIPAPWEHSGWDEQWKQRPKTVKEHQPTANWRQELSDHLDAPRPNNYDPNTNRTRDSGFKN